jgi:hypothetical protein
MNRRRRSKFLPLERLGGEIGRRTGLKIQRGQLCAGSIPAQGTKKNEFYGSFFFA